MASIAEVEKTIENKIKLLNIIDTETADVIGKKNLRDLERHKKLFENKLEEIHELKTKVIELKIAEDEAEAGNWGKNLKERLTEMEEKLDNVDNAIKQLRRDIKYEEQRENEEQEQIKRDKQAKIELEIEKAKIEMRMKNERIVRENENARVKLPKLVISRFQGNHLDWLRFWNEFETEIDKSTIPTVSKFAYLKEMLIPKVRIQVDGLPFTSEGYERAKSILKTTYGKPSEVANAHIQRIISLPHIHHHSITKLHEFYETLMTSVQSLDTMGKLKEINGYVRLTLDKLPTIRADLVRLDDDWQEWKFGELIEALRKWAVRNPKPTSSELVNHKHNNKIYQTRHQRSFNTIECVYCGNTTHKSFQCGEVKDISERKKLISDKRLCFNCIREGHRATDCTSKRGCYHCGQRHHSSICNKQNREPNQLTKPPNVNNVPSSKSFSVSSEEEEEVIYPVAIVKVNGIRCRALLDSAAGSSYIAAPLIDQLRIKPSRREKRNIEMLMHTATRTVSIYNINITDLSERFHIMTEVTKVDKRELLTLPNPKYDELVTKYKHLRDIKMMEDSKLEELPIQIILGIGDVTKIKTTTRQKIGRIGEPVAEYTRFGWVVTSPGRDHVDTMFLTRSSTEDYEKLCQTDVLGVQDQSADESVYEDFKNQLTRSDDGWYETSLLWKPNHPILPSNRKSSLARLSTLLKKLNHNEDLLEQYDQIIREQLDQGIIERVTDEDVNKGFYLPHRPVIREDAETTKVRVVYDASARADNKSPSLNECLETGPSLQNRIWNILVKTRFQPIILTGDIKKAFHQIRVREEDRDYMKFHWIKDLKTQEVETMRFTRVLFGLNQSPFLLGGTLETHLEREQPQHAPEIIEEIKQSTYVDDVITGGSTLSEVKQLKDEIITIFSKGTFEMHKWHSNMNQLEQEKEVTGEETVNAKILGVPWNKTNDTLSIALPNLKNTANNSKRDILKTLASIFDPLGLIAPVTFQGKRIYRDACDEKLTWDEPLSRELNNNWERFKTTLDTDVKIQRTICLSQEPIEYVDLHAFGDASKDGTAAALYAVVKQPSNINQGLIASSCRLAKKDTTIPRLELTASHMAANLLENTMKALSRFPIRQTHAWTDSKVALHWIRREGNYKQYVNNRVKKIRSKDFIKWRHVPGVENPADIGSRGCFIHELSDLWWKGPAWLIDENQWPKDIMTEYHPRVREKPKVSKPL